MDIFTVNKETCTKCGACAAVCQMGIINFQENSFPKPFPVVSEQMCTKCSACLIVCPNESFIHRDVSYEECPSIDSKIKISYEQCAQLLKTRRSIRTFQDKPVPRDVILQAIEAARFSPNGGNLQAVQWLIIDNLEMINNFREAGNKWLATVVKSGGPFAPLAGIFGKEGTDFFLRGAPAIVSAFAEKDRPVSTYDCAIALAYFDLAAISLGLGCYWNGFFHLAANNFPPIKDVIDLPRDCQIFGSLAVGYPKYKYNRIPMRNQARITWH